MRRKERRRFVEHKQAARAALALLAPQLVERAHDRELRALDRCKLESDFSGSSLSSYRSKQIASPLRFALASR